MKRKLTLILLSAVAAAFAVALSACSPHSHNYTTEVVQPTCTEKGYTLHTCGCGDSYSDNEVAALGHSEVTDAAVDATCTKSGLTEGKHCSVCGAVITAQKTVPAGHYFKDGKCVYCGMLQPTAGLEYTLNDDGKSYSVTGLGSADTEIIIAEKYNGLPVTAIDGYAFWDCSSLTSVTIPDGVTEIVGSAFYGCSGLTSITVAKGNTVYHSDGNCLIETESKTLITGCKNSVIPTDGSVTTIGKGAFYNCNELTGIAIPDSVTTIGDSAFRGCRGLTSITIPDSVTTIGGYAFRGCRGLESITVASGNTVYHSDGNCLIETESKTLITGCKNSVIPEDGSVTTIGSYAFYNCNELTGIAIPDSVTSIGDSAFLGCRGLTSITIPNGVTSIGNSVFYGCRSLTSVTIPDGVTSFGIYAFAYCGFTEIAIPDSVTSIGNGAFSECSSLASVTIPDSVTSIGNGAFLGCSGFTSITIPDSVSFLGSLVFGNCENLTSVTIGKGVSAINIASFIYCSELTEVVIPEGVTEIGRQAFRDCESITSVVIPASVSAIGSSAFDGCVGLTDVYYNGSEQEWAEINIDINNSCLTNATIHFNS